MYGKVIFSLIIIYIINPFAGVLSIILLRIFGNKKDSILDFTLFIFMTLYACLLQSTRIWKMSLPSDWNSNIYTGLFKEAGNTNLFEYVFTKKEPLWNLINYLGYYLNNGNTFYFFNEIAMLTIIFISLSIYIYWKHSNANPITLIASLSLIIFFVEYISILNNILRQFFALSIIIYAYTRKVVLNKSSFWILIAGCLIHTIGFIFLLLYFIKPMYERLELKKILKLSILVFVITLLISNIGALKSLFSSIYFITYAIDRLMNASDPNTVKDIIDKNIIFLNGSILIILTIFLLSNRNINKSMIFYANLFILLMMFCMSMSVIAPEIMSRIYISRFYFLPFILPYIFINLKNFHNIYIYGIIVFFIIRFFNKFDLIRGGGFFPPIDELYFYSVINFIFQ